MLFPQETLRFVKLIKWLITYLEMYFPNYFLRVIKNIFFLVRTSIHVFRCLIGFLNIFLDKGQARSPLEEGSSQRPLPTQNNTTYKHKKQIFMPSAGFEPAIPATKKPRPTPQTARPPELHINNI
jgi:hypothetical protein